MKHPQQSVSTLKKEKREAAAQRRPAQSERKNALFPRNDRPNGLKCKAFQAENALEIFSRPADNERVLGKMGESEGELRERLSWASPRKGWALFAASKRGFFPLRV